MVETIISLLISFIGGGALFTIVSLRLQRNKLSIEVSQELSSFYRGEIKHLTEQVELLRKDIEQLTQSNTDLRTQLTKCNNCKLESK